jgi:hypothetical protein
MVICPRRAYSARFLSVITATGGLALARLSRSARDASTKPTLVLFSSSPESTTTTLPSRPAGTASATGA